MLTGFCVQFDLLAQRPSPDQWGDILVLLVMAIVWLAAGLAKVLAARKGAPQGRGQDTGARQKDDRRETWQGRLAHKAQEFQRSFEAKARQLEQATTGTPAKTPTKRPSPPQPPAGNIRIRRGAGGDSVMVYERPASQPARDQVTGTRRHVEARQAIVLAGRQITKPQPLEPLNEPLTEITPPSLEAATAAPASSAQPAGFRPGDIIDYSDPDALKRAILYSETLGKPLALRESTDETSLF